MGLWRDLWRAYEEARKREREEERQQRLERLRRRYPGLPDDIVLEDRDRI